MDEVTSPNQQKTITNGCWEPKGTSDLESGITCAQHNTDSLVLFTFHSLFVLARISS